MSKKKLTKEGTNAINVLRSCFEEWDGCPFASLHVSEEDMKTGYTGFSKEPITLQRGTSWRWNRTVNILDINYSNDTTVNLQKMNSRSCNEQQAPPYKIWLFTINKQGDNPLYFIWCEKGISEGIPSVLDYAFLKPFVTDASVADEIWKPEKPENNNSDPNEKNIF